MDEEFRKQLTAGLEMMFGPSDRAIVDRIESSYETGDTIAYLKDGRRLKLEDEELHRYKRWRFTERYAYGWTDPRAVNPTPAAEPEYEIPFHLDAPSGITIRWYHRLMWRAWRWAIHMQEKLK